MRMGVSRKLFGRLVATDSTLRIDRRSWRVSTAAGYRFSPDALSVIFGGWSVAGGMASLPKSRATWLG